MLEFNNLWKKNIKSIFISKFCFKYSKSISKSLFVEYYLIVKKKKKLKINFLFIILLLTFGVLPCIIKTKKKKQQKDEFLAFQYKLKKFEVYKFISYYLPISDIVENLKFKFNNQEYRMTIKHFPIINEIDKICVINSGFLDYIQDYKLILKIQTKKVNWYFSECLIRSLTLPLISNNRFYL